jgi:spore germination cell wall hydrolase CwlJ-like protein
LQFGTQARADWRVLLTAAVLGSGVGMTLGAAYLAGGMGQAAVEHSRAERIASQTDGAFAEGVLMARAAGMDAGVLRLAQPHDPFARGQMGRDGAMLDALQQGQGAKPSRARELECLTQAVYFEARGESPQGQAAVAQVVMNRVKHPSYPKTVCGVVFQGAARSVGCQFSFACDGSMRRGREDAAWKRARRVAARALSGAVLADIGSATHFHTTAVAPAWGSQMRRVGQVGLHVFYKFHPKSHRANTPVLVSAPLSAPPQLQTQPTMRLSNAVLEQPAEAPAASEPPAASAPATESAPAALTKGTDAVAKAPATDTTAS